MPTVARLTPLAEHIVKQPPSPIHIIEAALLTSPVPLTKQRLTQLFDGALSIEAIDALLQELVARWRDRGLILVEVQSGWRFQSTNEVMPYLARLSDQKPTRYSRAAMETLAIIAYRQPATRGDIEEIRGVKVNPDILRAFQERGWIDVVGHRDSPGRPELFGTTQQFLDDLGLKSLDELPMMPEPSPETFHLFDPDPTDGSDRATPS